MPKVNRLLLAGRGAEGPSGAPTRGLLKIVKQPFLKSAGSDSAGSLGGWLYGSLS